MLSDEELHPLSLRFYSWNSLANIDPGLLPADGGGSLFALVPLVLAFLMLQRYRRTGLTAGSVK
jgi:multiple sugar transport system permease protein